MLGLGSHADPRAVPVGCSPAAVVVMRLEGREDEPPALHLDPAQATAARHLLGTQRQVHVLGDVGPYAQTISPHLSARTAPRALAVGLVHGACAGALPLVRVADALANRLAVTSGLSFDVS